MGEKMFDDFVKCCRTEFGYAALADVTSKQPLDEMDSFVLAETSNISICSSHRLKPWRSMKSPLIPKRTR